MHLTPILQVLNTQLLQLHAPSLRTSFSPSVLPPPQGRAMASAEVKLCCVIVFQTGGGVGGAGRLCCSRHDASVGCLRSALLIIPRHSGAITQMLGCNITAVDGQCRGTSQMDLGLSSSCWSPCCPTIWKQSHSPFRTRNRFSLGATYS